MSPLDCVPDASVLGMALGSAFNFGITPGSVVAVGVGAVGVAAETTVVVTVWVFEFESVVVKVSVREKVVMVVA